MSRDEFARRALADQVKAAVLEGANDVANDAYSDGTMGFTPETTPEMLASAAAAVVMASDLRAPAETRQQFIERLKASAAAQPCPTCGYPCSMADHQGVKLAFYTPGEPK